MSGPDSVAAAAKGMFAGRRLKVLLVSYWFPPANAIGAIRVGHFARSLYEAGHDIRVLTAQGWEDQSLPLALPADRVTYVRAPPGGALLDPLVRPFLKLARRFGAAARPRVPDRDVSALRPRASDQTVPAVPPLSGSVGMVLRNHYYCLVQFPDAYASWTRPATAAAHRLVKHWRPDIILASAPPNSVLIAARRIARMCGAPWIADLRDLWSDNSYYGYPLWRLWLDRLHERFVLRSAAGLVTVSPIWADILRGKYRQPVACVLNGFVSEDFPAAPTAPGPGDVVSICHTGTIYAGYRDPTPLFRAIALLSVTERRHVAVHFFGLSERDTPVVRTAAAAAGVSDRIFLHARVPYRESLSLQQSADILLLLHWNNIRDAGMIPAKFFEYLRAGRPILFIGYEHGDVAQIIRERDVGVIANDPPVIAEQLRRWIEQRPAGIPAVRPAAREGMSRDDQYRKFEQFLAQLILR
ncbi:MAG: glycosyltransferase [Alphaproteobacteria bacterium]